MEAEDAGAGRLDALVLKLRHPLAKIRARALRSLLFKLRERLVRVAELEPLQTALVPALLASLEPALELPALHVLQLLVQSRSEPLLASLQHFGAAQKLQRAASRNPELQPNYEKLLRQIYVTKLVEPSAEQVSNEEEREQETYPEQELRTSRVLDERRRAPKVADLEARGWRFAQVTLATVDEQYLFEFEVKLQLRTETQDLVGACATFRNELLRNFPAEVFLQRPAVIQHLLHLVQQPVLPGSPSSGTEQRGDTDDALMERAMEVSMGVNYFDEMLNSTFSNKRGNLSGAVVMASLKAIESFLYALKRTRRICLDPTYVVHTPNVHVELFDSYDTRRVQYPRQSAEVGNDDGRLPRQRNSSADQLEQFSLSGAVYKIFMSILPLLRSARHPRLHLLNLLITALPDLPENGYPFLPETNVAELNNLRLENIFVLLSGICRPGVSEQVDNTMVDADLDFTDLMTWKLVELVLRLFKLYPPSQYYVEEISSKANTIETSRRTETSDYIIIPRSLWEVVKLWVSNPAFFRVASNEWNDKSLVKNLPKIDETIPTFISLKHSSQQDARHIFAFVAFAKTHQEQIAGFGLSEKPAILSLEVAQKTIQTRSAFNNMDAEFIADATIQAIWFVLIANGNDETERIAEKDIEVMQFILCDLLSGSSDTTALVSRDSMVVHFLRRLMDLVDRFPNEFSSASIVRGRQFINEVICEPKFLSLLLLVLAEQDRDSNDHTESAAFWGILRFALIQFTGTSSDRLELLQSVVPLLQHFAYIEPSNKTTQEQRLAQPQLAEVLNRLEATTPDSQRYVLMCRCLLHNSSYIRKAAASGILQLLSRVSPSCIEWITKDKEIRDDPFGGTFFRDGKSLTLERELMESPLPVAHTSNYQPSENELSSQLTKLSHLCTVISGTSAGFGSIREAALKELVMFIENASVELLNLFEELDKLSNLMDLLCGILQADGVQKESSTIEQALLLFRTLLLRSRLLRSAMQNDTTVMELLMPLIFYPTPSIRTQVYYILLLLTCSAENFVPTGAPADLLSKDRLGEASIPEMIKSTFGLHSSRWSRCFIVFCSLKQQLQVSRTLLMKRVDPNWMQEVKTLINQAPFQDELTNHGEHRDQFPSSLVAEYTYIVSRIRDAPSHGKCLNAVYHLMTVCEAWGFARRRFVEEWEADFERYFAVPPKSERDEVIISSLVCTLSVMFRAMTRKEQLRALVVVKRKILPLVKRSQSKVFSLQIARLLLNVSESHVDDLFVSLAADTDIIATICTKYSAVYAVEPVLHAVMLQVLLRFAKGIAENSATRVSIPWREKICKRLLEMLSPLLSVVCHHRVPGTFLERDIFVVGSQCLVAILQTLSRESLLSTDSPLEHSDSNILIEGSWASRFLFDHVSPIRELGFLVIEHIAIMDPPSSRLLEMVFETSTDDTESDAVRAAACNVITKEILRFHDSPGDQQAAMVEIFHGITFSGRALRSLTNALKTRKLFPRSASAFAQLVRVLYIQNDRLAPRFGDLLREMELAEEEFDFYPLLVHTLSLREWKDKCNQYSTCCMLLPCCDSDAWRLSVLPAILDLMIEVLNLLQAIFREAGFDQVTFFLKHTTLQYQLMELVRDTHASLEDTDSNATKQRHYDVLDLCAGTLSILLVQSFDQHSECNSEQFETPSTSGFGAAFVDVVVKLLESDHPVEFRVSFSRVVPAMSLLIPGSVKSSDASVVSALCSAVFDLYREVSEFRPLDATTSTDTPVSRGHVFPLTSIRRVAYAFQVLVETSASLQQFVQIKHALPFVMTSIKELFTAVRVAGGFGGKRARTSNTSSSTQDVFVLDLCGRIQTHMEVMSAVVGDNKENQQLAQDEGLLYVVLSNWSVMKTAHVRGSQLLLCALHLLANYIYGNDTTRDSLLISLPPASGKAVGDKSQTLLTLLLSLASTRGEIGASSRHVGNSVSPSAADTALSNAACEVLKAVLLNTECVLASVKTGSISKLIDSLQERLKQARQTRKTHGLELENLAHMLSVLSGIACNEEGARVLYVNWSTVLSLVFGDAIHSSDAAVRHAGCLFMRNLALSESTKNHFAVWEELLDEVVAACIRASSTTATDVTTLQYLSATLWSLVFDNQRARALLLSRPTALQNLHELLTLQQAQSTTRDIAENLRRVLLLVQE